MKQRLRTCAKATTTDRKLWYQNVKVVLNYAVQLHYSCKTFLQEVGYKGQFELCTLHYLQLLSELLLGKPTSQLLRLIAINCVLLWMYHFFN